MFIEKLEPIDLGEPIYGRTIVGCAPKRSTYISIVPNPSIDISPLRGFSDRLLKQGVNERHRKNFIDRPRAEPLN